MRKIFSTHAAALLLAAVLFHPVSRATAQLANVWHIPDNTGDLGFNMRNPESAIGASTAVSFYTGLYKWNSGNLVANQTGGTLFYKTAAQSAWNSAAMGFYSNSGNNQYWQASLPGGSFNAGDTVQYFFRLNFDGSGSSGATDTWLYGGDSASSTTGSSNTAAAGPFSFVVSNNIVGTPVLTVNGVNADYTTTHVFVNELNHDAVPLTLLFAPNADNATNVEIFSNLNRRDRATLDANGDGIEDGILPPDGNTILVGDDSNYYKAYAMTNLGGGQYALTLDATTCGAYRLTARFQIAGSTNWNWYSTDGRRDHCIVVTPTKARNMVLYELNVLNIDGQGTNEGDRSTFADLDGGPGARPYDPVTNRFNLQYFQNLGVNWLWLQPIHPIGILNRQTDGSGQPYSVGSPYSVKNFFQVNPLMSKANTRAAAMNEFTNFVAAADAAGINVMLDEPFNHTAWDCELDQAGVNYFAPGASPTNLIAATEARFYSRTNEYDQRAYSAGTIAPAPDRYDFGKWTDVADIYYGRYAALVANASQIYNQTNEGDWFDYSIGSENGTGSGNGHFDTITQNVWRYFSDCILYWLTQTGCTNGTSPADQVDRGIDGLRADFGQGLPPQCWEYIINKVRSRKWDFVFMSESLDGGPVTYRSNRQFDVLNENLLFDLQNAASASDYRNAFDARRSAYGQGLILLNNTSHDEESYADPYQALIRYLACCTIDGAPMTFYGEELGISTTFGFSLYQLNMGKTIPQFMVFNSLQPVCNPANRNYGLDQLWPVYQAANDARAASPALRSSNRYYLNQTGSGAPQPEIFSIAKYATPNGAPNFSDVVFAFTPLDRNNPQSGTFNVNITQNGSNLFGIQPGRLYNVKNLSAYTAIDPARRNDWLWNGGSGGIAGSNILANGIYVSLNPVPSSDAAWAAAPFEAQDLKLYDVTPPPAPTALADGTTNDYVFTNVVTFTWPAVTDAQGGISGYHVLIGTTPGGADVLDEIIPGPTLTVTNSFGAHLYATVAAVNNAGIAGAAATNSVALVSPAWIPVASMAAPALLSWSSVSGQVYQVWSTTNLAVPFTAYSGTVTATAPVFTYPCNPTNSARFYKIQLIP